MDFKILLFYSFFHKLALLPFLKFKLQKLKNYQELQKKNSYLHFFSKETFKLLMKGEGKSEPAHEGVLPALPEVDNKLVIVLNLILVLLRVLRLSWSLILNQNLLALNPIKNFSREM